nr:MAG TPA: hypothetical protein [Caudoviricetes sp.]
MDLNIKKKYFVILISLPLDTLMHTLTLQSVAGFPANQNSWILSLAKASQNKKQ